MNLKINNWKEYQEAYKAAESDPEKFWADIAQHFYWKKPWDKVLNWDFYKGTTEWFINGKLNITENCLDRHLEELGNSPALIWEPASPDQPSRTLTYKELHHEVCRFSNVLTKLGIKKGDRICLYMPMVPELAISVLACARVGAIHSVVFAGFSAQSLSDRINDSSCKLVITADEANRGIKKIPVKGIVDEALKSTTSVEKVIVLKHTNGTVNMLPSRDLWWHDLIKGVATVHQAEVMDSEDSLFILYTSGSTGKPKGVVHSSGGYMVYTAYSFQNVFQYRSGEIFWCTADIGWITGHSYIIYGPLLSGATTLMFEGIPTWPDPSRFWQVIERHKVNIFYTAPTAIRSLEAYGTDHLKGFGFESVRVIGSVGEPINEEAWHWFKDHIGRKTAPLVDTWWQTETGGILISALAGISLEKPGFAGYPLPGIMPVLVDEKGTELKGNGISGNLCIKFPWPSIIRTTYGDHERCRQNYFATYPGFYFTGDGCRRDEDGMYRITGRVDDVINVSGHRIGTAEVENAINQHPDVVESAVVGYPHQLKGQGLYAFVICTSANSKDLEKEIRDTVTKIIGPIAKPDKIQVVEGLPKTRSGKIMRRILRKIAEGNLKELGDTSTLLDPGIVDKICAGAPSES